MNTESELLSRPQAGVRAGDPSSSFIAAEDVEANGSAKTKRTMALSMVRHHEGHTTHELAERWGQVFGLTESGRLRLYESLHRRLPELRALNLAASRVQDPPCTVCGRRMQRWWSVETAGV